MSLRTAVVLGLMATSLAACDTKPTVIDGGPKDTPEVAEALKKPIVLPPSIAASKQFRCTDNSLLFVDFYSDDRSASVRTARDGAATRVEAAKPGDSMTGGGITLNGSRTDARVSVTLKAGGKQLSCRSGPAS